MEATDMINLIPTLGFPIVCVIAVGIVLYKIITRVLDENKDREEKARQDTIEREKQHANDMAEHIKATNELSKVLQESTDTIRNCQELNKELTETNRLLVSELRVTVSNIDNNIKDIKDALSNK